MIFDALTYSFIVIGIVLSVTIFRLIRTGRKNQD